MEELSGCELHRSSETVPPRTFPKNVSRRQTAATFRYPYASVLTNPAYFGRAELNTDPRMVEQISIRILERLLRGYGLPFAGFRFRFFNVTINSGRDRAK
jgi:hypothetical protein